MDDINIVRLLDRTRIAVPHNTIKGIDSGIRGVQQRLSSKFIEDSIRWRVCAVPTCFNRRVTCIEWHPLYPNLVAFSSHGGDILLCNTETIITATYNADGLASNNLCIDGVGCGSNSVTDMVFNPDQPFHMYVTSLDGTFSMKDLNNKHTEVYNDTMDLRYWWTSVALSSSIVFVGGNTGKALVLNKEGKTLFTYPHFHKDKVHHAEFSPIQDHVLVTSSNDKTVALWDMRMLGESPQPNKIVTIKQEAPITSVYFDPLYGSSLLTTSQNSEIRVYHSYNYENPALVMKHPHRNFQHMTHIKATWHPLYEDICIIGRYADADDPDKTRCVDIVNLKESAVVGQFYDPSAKQIMTVNKLNKAGDILATGMGYTALLWRMSEPRQLVEGEMKENHDPSRLKLMIDTLRKKRQSNGGCGKRKKNKSTETMTKSSKNKKRKLI